MEERTQATVDVSVVIIVRNGAATIRRQLDALAAQVDAPPFEVVVSNNGSTDATVDVVRQWERDGIGAAERLVIADASAKPGIPYARNMGAKAASGRLLAFCDADDAVHPDWVGQLAAHVQDGIAGGGTIAWRDGVRDDMSISSGLTATGYLPHVSGCNWAITRDTFFSIGGFDESLPVYGCDDVDISWRAQEHGHPIQFVPSAKVDFTITTSGGEAVRKTFRAAKARIAVALRYPESLSGQRLTIGTCLTEAARNTVMLPWCLARPGATPRTRILRSLVASYGRLAGYWTYGIRKKPAQYIDQETP